MDDQNNPVNRPYYGSPPEQNQGPVKSTRKPKRQPPQTAIAAFWDEFNTKYPGKVLTVLPDNQHAVKKAAQTPHGAVKGQCAAKSYDQAKAECERQVDRIVKECRRVNQKYRDPHFDIEFDLKSGRRNCLDGLSSCSEGMKPKGVGRVTDIFEKPEFYINGPTSGDVRQGRDGDCYFMAALCGLGNMKGEPLIHKVCVKHDQQVGVYGFVFFRDGEWQQTIVDDKLYLRAPDYEEAQEERRVWDEVNRIDSEEEYRKAHQTGSRALYFAQCADENETWLPLLEKAYAKAHGDYSAIDGGFTGEAIEDLTGGVTSEIYSTDILDREAFWRDGLLQVGKDFLFGCATGFYSNWLDPTGAPRDRNGIAEGHAYSIMDAVELQGKRLLKLRNPWGKKEWDGRWSDGSSEWTPEWMQLLDHKFGNDGVFWISYDDLLRKYQHFDRTRIFDDQWSVTQTWTPVHVPWAGEYLSTKFRVTLREKSSVVIVLTQLDDTYFKGLEGGYSFGLQFRLEEENKAEGEEDDYIVRSNGNYAMARGVSTDIELEAGTYSVLMKITARRTGQDEVEDVLPIFAASRREKLIQMGLSYDLAHAKGILVESDEEKAERLRKEKARKAKDREKLKIVLKKQAKKDWKKSKARHQREKKMRQKDKERALGQRPRQGSGETDNANSLAVGDGSLRDDEGGFRPTGVVRKENRPSTMSLRPRTEIQTSPEMEAAPDAPRESIPTDLVYTMFINQPQKSTSELLPTDEDVEQHFHEILDPRNGDGEDEPVEENPPTPKVQINGVDAITDVKPLPTNPPLSSLEHQGPDGTNVEPFAFAEEYNRRSAQTENQNPDRSDRDGTAGMFLSNNFNGVMSPDREGEPEQERDPPSDVDSYPDFDWQSDLDMPTDDDDDDDDPDTVMRNLGRRPPNRQAEQPDGAQADNDGSPDSLNDIEPWNAVCVVGLRVYSMLQGEDVKVEVVRPADDDDEEAEMEMGKGGEAKGKQEDVLDPDDMSKGALAAEAVGQAAGVRMQNGVV